MLSLQLVSSYCPFPVSSSSSVALLGAVDHPSIVNLFQSSIPLVFLYAFVASQNAILRSACRPSLVVRTCCARSVRTSLFFTLNQGSGFPQSVEYALASVVWPFPRPLEVFYALPSINRLVCITISLYSQERNSFSFCTFDLSYFTILFVILFLQH